jgi:hypothetical protein
MCAVPSENSEDGPIGAVTRVSRLTQFTLATTGINLTSHALAHHRFVFCLLDDANKLVADSSIETSVASCDLEIRITYSGEQYSHEDLASRFRFSNVAY